MGRGLVVLVPWLWGDLIMAQPGFPSSLHTKGYLPSSLPEDCTPRPDSWNHARVRRGCSGGRPRHTQPGVHISAGHWRNHDTRNHPSQCTMAFNPDSGDGATDASHRHLTRGPVKPPSRTRRHGTPSGQRKGLTSVVCKCAPRSFTDAYKFVLPRSCARKEDIPPLPPPQVNIAGTQYNLPSLPFHFRV